MKKLFYTIPVFLSILLAISVLLIHNVKKNPEIVLVDSFKLTGARVATTEVYSWGRVKREKLNDIGKMKKMAEGFAEELKLIKNDKLVSKSLEDDLITEVDISGQLSEGRTAVITIKADRTGSDEGYIYITVAEDQTTGNMLKTRRDMENSFRKYGIVPVNSSCITGNFNGKLGRDEMEKIAKDVFKAAGAEKRNGMADGGMISITAYAPVIGSHIVVNRERVNLNLAIRYNSYENKTYIWLATPLITTEY